MQQSSVKFYRFDVQTLLNMFWTLLFPSSGLRQTVVAASGFRMNVEVDVFSAVVGLSVTNRPRQSNKILRLIVASSWVFYLSDWRCTKPQTLKKWKLFFSSSDRTYLYRASNLKSQCFCHLKGIFSFQIPVKTPTILNDDLFLYFFSVSSSTCPDTGCST